ncbi:hypothetical protein IDH44_10515 [Paenibacillus sp. IB182496]|uniref:Sensory rhodopsin transducer n=1 Tax=Paenibacillus sabuli TaxID=2772509 RepID=A0A927BRV5_9BACL|nr:sensory rhodopsin transducer [Paenibacillus sabuli]MBD2845622.1 hypothetical protein [Paenibacillus sabuli]
MAAGKGEKHWIIPDGYIPEISSGVLESHESICVLNAGREDALLTITIFYEDRDPLEEIAVFVPARRTKHIRTKELQAGGVAIPHGVPYAIEVVSDVPVVVQYSRLDATQAENALMTTMGYPLK